MTLVEVDISCSQLFFSTFLLNHRHWKYKSSKPYLDDLWKHIDINSNSNRVEYNNSIMSINSYETFYGKGFQNHDFVKKCSEGLLYESILDKLAIDGFYQPNHDYQVKRNKVKTILLDQLFADPTDPGNKGLFCRANKPILDSFTALYPGVLEVYRQIKEVNYKDICRLFQRIESIAMIGYVCKRLQHDYPEVPIFTLHDCLITTVGNEILVSRVMAECIDEFVGYIPKMKIKYWRDYAKEIDQYLEDNKAA